MAGAAVTAAAAAPQAGGDKRAIIDLTYYRLRNSQLNERQALTDFLRTAVLPAVQRSGAAQAAFFSSVVGQDSPYVLSAASYPSLAALAESERKLTGDKQYQEALESYSGSMAQGYIRIERSLLRAFSSVPTIETPARPQDGSLLFELRVYESNTPRTLERKVRMFDEGEVAIFRKYGLVPVFFGETIVGTNMPNLTYMIAFKSLADREQAWQNFVTSPEWKELSRKPGLSDAEIVSNISNEFLRGLPFSPIR